MERTLVMVGIVLMTAAVIGAIVAGAIFFLSGKHLREQMEREFGKKRH